LAAALGVTKLVTFIVMNWVTLCCPAQSNLDVQQARFSSLPEALPVLSHSPSFRGGMLGLTQKGGDWNTCIDPFNTGHAESKS